VTRPKGELVSQKGRRRSTSLSQSHRRPLFFDAEYPFTSKNSIPRIINGIMSPDYNVIDLRILFFYSPFYKGGYRRVFIAFSKISPTPSLEKRGALALKSMTLTDY
jgi:hypothetical protein